MMKLQLEKPLFAVLVTLLIGTAPVFAQEEPSKEKAQEEEVVVRGIRQSVEESLNIKQDATNFVDAISSEDIGKLPDQNVAEALQRVAGVAIQRSRGEGDFISIRGLGPDFVRGTVNGHSLLSATEAVDPIFNGNFITSTGRATNFDILPSEIVKTLEVFKSSSAKHVEGAIGGSVNVVTLDRLASDDTYVASTTGSYRRFNEEFDPSVAGVGSWTNEAGDLSGLLSISHNTRNIREDFSRMFGWFPSFGIVDTMLDTDNDGVADTAPSAVPFPLSNNAEVYDEDRQRNTLVGTITWQQSDNTDIVLDMLYSKRNVDESHSNLIFLPIIRHGPAADNGNDLASSTVNTDGSIQVRDLLTNGAFSTLPTTLRPELTTDLQDYEDSLLSFSINMAKRIDVWTLTADASYSKAEGKNRFDRVRIDGDNGTFAFNTTIGDDGFDITQTNQNGTASNLGNPGNFVISVFDDRSATNEDEEVALQFDIERAINSDVFSSLSFGGRYRTREKNVERATNGNGISVTGADITLASAGSYLTGADNFLDGTWNGTIDYSSLVFPGNAAARAALASYMATNNLSTALSADPFGTFSITEDTLAAYVQIDLDGAIGSVNYVGDIGFRVVLTDTIIGGNDAEFRITDTGGTDTTVFDTLTTGEATPIEFEESYTNVLPSMNFRFELIEELFLRVSASRTLTRPTFNNLAPAFQINANSSTNLNGDNYAVSLSAGNPDLRPYDSENYDIGIEWYFAESSAAYLGLFHKEIDNFIAVTTSNDVSTLAGKSIRAIGVEQDGTSAPINIDQVSQPSNQGKADITGLEMGYQQAFDNGFGFIGNITLAESSAKLITTNDDIRFPGVSDMSYNLTGYFERGPFSSRVSWSYRGEYLIVPDAIGFGGQIFQDGYGQLDATTSYQLSDSLTLFANAVNLTDETAKQYQVLPNGIGSRFHSNAIVGPRFAIGIRAYY